MVKTRGRGFTLVELLVVIAIMAILMALIFPIVGAITSRAKFHQWQGQSAKIKTDKECVVYYLFEEQDGTVVENLAAENPDRQEINGKITSATWDKGRWSQKGAMKFAASKYVTVKLPVALAAPYSIEVWAKLTTATSWSHYVYSNGVSYLNGVTGSAIPAQIMVLTDPTTTTAFKIGDGYAGLIDEIAIYSDELTSDEIKEHYEMGNP